MAIAEDKVSILNMQMDDKVSLTNTNNERALLGVLRNQVRYPGEYQRCCSQAYIGYEVRLLNSMHHV